MSSEDKKNYSEALKNYVIAASIVIGGLWAAYVFDARLEVDLAKSKLEKANIELAQRPVLVSAITVESSAIDSQNKWLLKAIVHIENKGNADVQIKIDQKSFRVAKVGMAEGVIAGFGEQIFVGERGTNYAGDTNSLTKIGVKTILSQQSKDLVFLVEVNSPGAYLVEFLADPGQPILDVRSKVDELNGGIPKIAVRDFIVVGSSPNKAFHPVAKRDG